MKEFQAQKRKLKKSSLFVINFVYFCHKCTNTMPQSNFEQRTRHEVYTND